ncbi:MAG: PfkB family carbohydrate kinase [Planctomycetota bacterium]
MSLVVVGSIALDTITTPHGSVENALGGSATYFSLAASLLTEVRLVGVVGEDFPPQSREILERRGIDTRGLQTVAGKTFRWTGAYHGDMNEANTLAVELNVFEEFNPRIPPEYADTGYVFLANASPSVQRAVREQLHRADLVVCDTMNYYIERALGELKSLIAIVDGLLLNDQEARMLTGTDALVEAGHMILDMGPRFVVIKKGEHGALLCSRNACVAIPAYPTREVKDPTGAGDSFAGAFMGRLATDGDLSLAGLKRAIAYGTAAASLTVEGFGTSRIEGATLGELDARFEELREMLAL